MPLNTAFCLHDQHPRHSVGVGYMLTPDLCVKDISTRQGMGDNLTVDALVHVYRTVQNDEDLRTVVDVLFVGLVGSVKADTGFAVKSLDIQR